VNIRDERSVGEQVRSGLRLAGWILLTFAVVGVTLLSEKTLLDRSGGLAHLSSQRTEAAPSFAVFEGWAAEARRRTLPGL